VKTIPQEPFVFFDCKAGAPTPFSDVGYKQQDRRIGKQDRRWPENSGRLVLRERRTCFARRISDFL
jgi:hypothetical protein